jgi:hypothetical protein
MGTYSLVKFSCAAFMCGALPPSSLPIVRGCIGIAWLKRLQKIPQKGSKWATNTMTSFYWNYYWS